MKRSYRYNSYQGKSGARTFLKVLIAVLVLLLALLVAAYFFLQKYMVISNDGIRFELPFFQDASPTPTPSAPVVISTPPTIVVTPTPTPTPTPEPEDEEPLLQAAVLSMEELLEGAARDVEGAVVVDLKGEDGRLRYVSQLEFAKNIGSSASDPTLNDAIREANEGAGYTIARIVCYRDDLAPYMRSSVALRSGGGNWRDEKGLRWMSPASAQAREYLSGVCAEAAELGFDEILLTCAAFPVEGNLDGITKGEAYHAETFMDTVEGFYQEVLEALAPYPEVKLSIAASPAALTQGEDPVSGQTLSGLVDRADRVWCVLEEEERSDVEESLREAGLPAPQANLVSLLTEAPEEEKAYSWALLEE